MEFEREAAYQMVGVSPEANTDRISLVPTGEGERCVCTPRGRRTKALERGAPFRHGIASIFEDAPSFEAARNLVSSRNEESPARRSCFVSGPRESLLRRVGSWAPRGGFCVRSRRDAGRERSTTTHVSVSGRPESPRRERGTVAVVFVSGAVGSRKEGWTVPRWSASGGGRGGPLHPHSGPIVRRLPG